MRRIYQVMGTFAKSLILWLTALLLLSVTELSNEEASKDFYNTYTFVVLQLPFHLLVLFGCKTLVSIGYHLMVLENCDEAHDELKKQIELAKSELKRKGVKL